MDWFPNTGISMKPAANVPKTLPTVNNIDIVPAEAPTRLLSVCMLSSFTAKGATAPSRMPGKVNSTSVAATGPQTTSTWCPSGRKHWCHPARQQRHK